MAQEVKVSVLADGEHAGQSFTIGRSKTIYNEAKWSARKGRARVRVGTGKAKGNVRLMKSVAPETLATLKEDS